jgi:hypothetical protein
MKPCYLLRSALEFQQKRAPHKFRQNPEPTLITNTYETPLTKVDAMLFWHNAPEDCDLNRILEEIWKGNRYLQRCIPKGHLFVLKIQSLPQVVHQFNMSLKFVRFEKEDLYDEDNWREYEFTYYNCSAGPDTSPFKKTPYMNFRGDSFTATVKQFSGKEEEEEEEEEEEKFSGKEEEEEEEYV